MLAIHLNREIHEAGFKPNKQDHVTPVLATALKDEANKKNQNGSNQNQNGSTPDEVLRPGIV